MNQRYPLKDCPPSPNCVCTLATRPEQVMPPLPFEGDATAAIARVIGILERLPRVRIVERRDNYFHATFTTLVFRFVDDVEFFADSETKLLHFRSASRIGYSDLGVNRRRMQRLVKRIARTLD